MPKLSIEYIIHFIIYIHASFIVIRQLSFTFKLSLKVNLVPYQKSLDAELTYYPVGVQIFEHSQLKFTNVQILL